MLRPDACASNLQHLISLPFPFHTACSLTDARTLVEHGTIPTFQAKPKTKRYAPIPHRSLAWKKNPPEWKVKFLFINRLTCLSDSCETGISCSRIKLGANVYLYSAVIYWRYPLRDSLTLRCTMSHIIMLGIPHAVLFLFKNVRRPHYRTVLDWFAFNRSWLDDEGRERKASAYHLLSMV